MQNDSSKQFDHRYENISGPTGKGWRCHSFQDGHDEWVWFYVHADGRVVVFSRDRVVQVDLSNANSVRSFGIETQPLNSLVRLKIGSEIVASALTDEVAQQMLAMLRGEIARIEGDPSIKSQNDLLRIGAVIAAVVGVGTIAGFISGLATSILKGYFV